MNDVLDCLLTRRSIKKYTTQPVEREKLEQIVQAGTYAANGSGIQSPIIIAVTAPAVRNELAQLNAAVMKAQTDPFYGAPVVLCVLADRSCSTRVNDGRRPFPRLRQLLDPPRQRSLRHRARPRAPRPMGSHRRLRRRRLLHRRLPRRPAAPSQSTQRSLRHLGRIAIEKEQTARSALFCVSVICQRPRHTQALLGLFLGAPVWYIQNQA